MRIGDKYIPKNSKGSLCSHIIITGIQESRCYYDFYESERGERDHESYISISAVEQWGVKANNKIKY